MLLRPLLKNGYLLMYITWFVLDDLELEVENTIYILAPDSVKSSISKVATEVFGFDTIS